MNTPVVKPDNRRKLEFDKKLKQIESDELKLKALEQILVGLQTRMAMEITPVVEEFCQLRYENLTRLKYFLSDPEIKKKDKRLITHFMLELAIGLKDAGDGRADNFLDELLPKDEVVEKDDEYEKWETPYDAPPETEKQAEGKVEIKSLFRQLAKVFHPDKEPLEHLKEERTSLMKKITEAYENQDLYGLLKIEKEHMGPREFSEDKIELYIKHINDRLKELRSFENNLKKHGPLSIVYRFIYSRKTTIQEYNIRNEISKIEEEVEKERELQNVVWDKVTLKRFLTFKLRT